MSGIQSFFIWVLQVLLLSALLLFFLSLVLRPSDPTFTVVDFSISTSRASTTATVVYFGIEISNNSKGGGVCYSDMNITLYLDEERVGTARVDSFYQGHGRRSRKAGRVVAGGRLGVAVEGGAAELEVGLVTAVSYRIWWWRSQAHVMEMVASVPVGMDGKVSGEREMIQKK